MRPMRNSWAFVLLAAVATACEPLSFPPAAPPAPSPATRPYADDLKAENEQLRSQVAELRLREDKLSAEVQDLRFLTRQQKIQIQELAQAPSMRDKYKAAASSLRQEVRDLRIKSGLSPDANTPPTVETAPTSDSGVSPEVLARFLPASAPATAPASQPASQPADE